MSAKRPSLSKSKKAFKQVYDDLDKSVSSVGKFIGGKIDYNINKLTPAQGQFQNACAIRMSYVLNKTGVKIPFKVGKTVSGGQGQWYLYKVRDLITFLNDTFGKPDKIIHMPTINKVASFKGIIIFEVDEWSDATGHATIWDGVGCSDKCYFSQSKKAYVWSLKN